VFGVVKKVGVLLAVKHSEFHMHVPSQNTPNLQPTSDLFSFLC
jgi:hypothetical protein